MPNVLLSPAVPGTAAGSSSSGVPAILAGSAPLYDPRRERANRRRFRREMIPKLDLANSLYVPSGRWPARGWVLLRRGDYNTITPFSISLQLQIDDLDHAPLTFNDLTVVQARCVSTGASNDADAIYLVELTDRRGVLWNQWFQFPTISSYNVRAPAYLQQFYSPSTFDGTNGWTWSQMIGDLWGQMGSFLGPYPGLPVVPSDTPEGYSFPGTSCWTALNDVLDLLGCSVACDLTQANPYTIVDNTITDPAFAALQTRYADLLEDDLQWTGSGSGRTPKFVQVMFHRRNQYYGTEETVRPDSFQWSMTPFYSVTVQGPFAGAAGTQILWCEFTVRYDVDNNPLAADVATANTIALERANEYFGKIRRGTQDSLWQLYAGVLPFVTGSSVDGVAYRMDYKDDYRKGWVTEVVRGPQPPWEEVHVDVS